MLGNVLRSDRAIEVSLHVLRTFVGLRERLSTHQDFALSLIQTARKLYAEDSFGLELTHTVYALDSTTIDLCLALFPWARFRKHKGAVKLHTLLDRKMPSRRKDVATSRNMSGSLSPFMSSSPFSKNA